MTKSITPARSAVEAAAAEAGTLPEWNLADLYPAMDSPELSADLETARNRAGSFQERWRGKLAAAGDFHAIRAKLDERPYRVRIVASNPRAMAAALIRLGAVDSVSVDAEGALEVLSRNVSDLQRSVPQLAQEQGIRLLRVEPLDESLESVFSYLVER